MSKLPANHAVNAWRSLPSLEGLPAVLGAAGRPQLVVVNLDPDPQEMLRRVGACSRGSSRP